MKTCMVWNQPVPLGDITGGAHCGTHNLHQIVRGLDAIWWTGDNVAAAVGSFDCYIVNLFTGMKHVQQIRAKQPNATIVALPDEYFDEVFLSRDQTSEAQFILQLKLADVIGYTSESNLRFYSAFRKPMVRIPIPIGTEEFFAEARKLPKADYIITTDHSPRAVDYTIQNVAALAMIQRSMQVDVVYCNPGPHTQFYAEQFGLRADFRPKLSYDSYVRLAARARLGVDMYARHGFGRNEMTLAYAGTACVGSTWTDMRSDEGKCDPWDAMDASWLGSKMLRDLMDYGNQPHPHITEAIQYLHRQHSFVAVREHWPKVIEEISHAAEHAAT